MPKKRSPQINHKSPTAHPPTPPIKNEKSELKNPRQTPPPPPIANPATPYSTIAPKQIHWLWPDRIPRGKITLIIGDPGVGKSLFTLDLAARLSRCAPFPSPQPAARVPPVAPTTERPNPQIPSAPITNHQSPVTNPTSTDSPFSPQATLLLTAEDDPADTIRPRLDALGADLAHIHQLHGVPTLTPTKNQNGPGSSLSNADNPLAPLEAAIQSIPNLALVVIDPISAFLGYTDRIIDRSRTVLSALADLAAQYNFALLLTARLNKCIPQSQRAYSLYRVAGSAAFVAAARAIHLITGPTEPSLLDLDPRHDDAIAGLPPPPSTRVPHLFIPIKINLAHKLPALAFHIENARIDWLPHADASAFLADAALQEVALWLRAALIDGPIRSQTLHKEAHENAIPKNTLLRAKRLLAVERTKTGFNDIWFWRLPGDTRPPANETDRTLLYLASIKI